MENDVILQSAQRQWHINRLIKEAGMQDIILMMHAFLGCDQTSRVYGVGKGKIVKNKKHREACRQAAALFYAYSSTSKNIKAAGEKLMLNMLNREKEQDMMHVDRK